MKKKYQQPIQARKLGLTCEKKYQQPIHKLGLTCEKNISSKKFPRIAEKPKQMKPEKLAKEWFL